MVIQRLLVLSALPLMIGSFGLAAPSQAQSRQETLTAQASPQQPTEQKRGGWGRKFEQLNLTEAQKAQIQQIKQSQRQQMEAILTAEQRAQKQAAREQRQRPNLNLTEDQRTRMQAVKTAGKSQIEAVLTPAQRQQLEQMRSTRGQRRTQPQPTPQ